jgi:perosamine synthetase
MPDMDGIRAVARRHGLAVIEDAAEAIGSEYKRKKAGGFGDAGVFSFHGSKTLTTGEGGMLVTDREDLHHRALVLRDHGREPGDKAFWNREVGYKYRMSSMQAALGLAQLERIEELIARKREIRGWYADELGGVEGLTLNHEGPETRIVPWMVTVIVDARFGLTKDRVLAVMSDRGIDGRPFFHPLSSLPAYAHLGGKDAGARRNPVSYRLSPFGVNLPSAMSLTRENVAYVCRALRDILRGVPSKTARPRG